MRYCKSWYVKFDCDAYALGPCRFDNPISEDEMIDRATRAYGERPAEVWPADGEVVFEY